MSARKEPWKQATALLCRAVCSEVQDREAIRAARSVGQAAYLARLLGDAELREALRKRAAGGWPSRWSSKRSKLVQDQAKVPAKVPSSAVERALTISIIAAIHQLPKPASRAQLRDHLAGKGGKRRGDAGAGALAAWGPKRVENALNVLWEACVLVAPKWPGLVAFDLPAGNALAVDTDIASRFFPGVDWSAREVRTFASPAVEVATASGARPTKSSAAGAPGAFSLETWKRAIRSVDHRVFTDAWYEIARHNASAARPVGSSHALAAVDPNSVPPVSLLKDGRALNGPHPFVKHVVWHPNATCRHACFLALGSFANTPFVPHFLAVLRGGDLQAHPFALVALWLAARATPALRAQATTATNQVPPAVRARAVRLLAKHGLPTDAAL